VSRLDSFIRRLEAQRQCLGAAAARTADLPGCVLEFGLGNGRTYDHLREICGDREIYVFDRQVAAHPDCIPPADHLFVGDFSATLPVATARLGAGQAALVHVDLGSGDEQASSALAEEIAPQVAALMRSGAILVSDQRMPAESLAPTPLPDGIRPGRYFMAVRS
jgi:hypothetical protein